MRQELPLSQHDILDQDECARVRDQVIAQRALWTSRSDGGGFFTLGAASYLDAPDRHDVYLAAAAARNPALCRSFGWLHERIGRFFEAFLAERTFFDLRYAVPGFHIFILNGREQRREYLAARAHFDLQWMHAMPGRVPAEAVSFTLLVEAPSGGATMAVWPARYGDTALLDGSTAYAAKHAPRMIDYAKGRILVHDGYCLHAIGLSNESAPVGLRITLQGHGVRLPEGWLLYW